MLEFISVKDAQQSLGKWCKLMRKREKITQQYLADELSLSPITISKLENGENATLETILKVLQYFDELKTLNSFVVTKISNLEDHQTMY